MLGFLLPVYKFTAMYLENQSLTGAVTERKTPHNTHLVYNWRPSRNFPWWATMSVVNLPWINWCRSRDVLLDLSLKVQYPGARNVSLYIFYVNESMRICSIHLLNIHLHLQLLTKILIKQALVCIHRPCHGQFHRFFVCDHPSLRSSGSVVVVVQAHVNTMLHYVT